MTDFYELTMANGYFLSGKKDEIVYFDLYYRDVPDRGGFAIFAGLKDIVEYIQNLKFTEEDINFLRTKNIFSEEFLKYLKDFKFSGDIYAMPEGSVFFPGEPVMTVRAKAIEAQLIETYVLAVFNHQSLIATKANRVVRAAKGRVVSEFGARRAHGAEAAYKGARAAYIGLVTSTSNTLADVLYGIPASGTMAHSWVQMFDTELEAFETYCKMYPNNSLLLIDTYDTLKQGIYNAIKAFDNVLKPLGKRPLGVRIDSGDLAYQSKQLRKILDKAGYPDCKIVVSNSLDEYSITALLEQGAKIDIFGVGERLITSKSWPVFGGVYKLAAIEQDGVIIPKIKISESVDKITTPHFKQVYRLYENGKASADYITIYDEVVDDSKPLEIFDPYAIWKRKTLETFEAKALLIPIFKKGKLVYKMPDLLEIREHVRKEIDSLWEEVKRFDQPHNYYVDLSQKLWDCKEELLLTERKN
ncbi:MAG TPA: nicotinate phosphoribosyltransferase [Acholeplasmataceae bacterium]|jgi:nicotinate phosphoribosyltransferase|nr:nicotinate phosphoribosyltransferase [Acholeplasmataceae bacterium]